MEIFSRDGPKLSIFTEEVIIFGPSDPPDPSGSLHGSLMSLAGNERREIQLDLILGLGSDNSFTDQRCEDFGY